MTIVFLNGQFIPREAALIPIDDRGFLFGHGVFTTIKVSQGRVQNLEAHLSRLKDHARALKIVPPIISFDLLGQLIQLNHAFEGDWKLKIIFTAGPSKLNKMDFLPHANFLMTLEKYGGPPHESRLTLFPHAITGPVAQLKSLSYLSRLCVADYASTNGFDDALVLSPEGWILESAYANIFWKMNSTLFTPDSILPYLKGITIKVVERAAQLLGLDWRQVKIFPSDIPQHAQIYLVNSMMGILPVVCCADRLFARDLGFEGLLKAAFDSELEKQSIFMSAT